MRYFFLTVFVALVIVATDVAALKCYKCGDIGDDACSKEKLEGSSKYSSDCGSSSFDRCMRTESDALGIKAVSTSCSTQEICSTAKSDCDQKKAGYENCKVIVCCSTDNCNTGSAVSFSVFLMAICYAVGLVLMK